MTGQHVINFLREHYSTLQGIGVQRIGLFGSYAKGTQQPESDIDILVELDEPSFFKMAYVQIFLEDNLKLKIDILRKGPHLRPSFLQFIESEIIYA